MSCRITVLILCPLIIGGLLQSCARNPELFKWTEGFRHAERQLEKRNYTEAVSAFLTLQRSALSRHDEAYAQMRRAESYRRAGDISKAKSILEELWATSKDLDIEQRAKLAYKLGRVTIDNGEKNKGIKHLKRVCQKFPNTIFGHRSFTYLRGVYRHSDRNAFIEWCRTMYRKRPNDELADNYLYEAARIYFERKTAEGNAKALALYNIILERWLFETSALWDDAMWDVSLIQHREGHYKDEIHSLRTLLSTRQFANWLGSYEIRNYKHAALRIGQIYYQDLKDYESARREFEKFAHDFHESRYVDDSMWWLGHTLMKLGDKVKADAVFAELVRKYPISKYARRVREGRPGP